MSATAETIAVTVEWIVDGFLHPPSKVSAEFVDVDDYLRIPAPGLSDAVQFAHLRVGAFATEEHIVVGTEGLACRAELRRFLAGRYPTARPTFLVTEKPNVVQVFPDPEGLAESTAACVAVTRYSLVLDDGKSITVNDGTTSFEMSVEYAEDKYRVICHRAL